jgi:hypothetical protein
MDIRENAHGLANPWRVLHRERQCGPRTKLLVNSPLDPSPSWALGYIVAANAGTELSSSHSLTLHKFLQCGVLTQ